jgi:hypothetical protein
MSGGGWWSVLGFFLTNGTMLPSQPLVKTGEVKMLVAERNTQDNLHFRVCALSRDGKTLAPAAEKAGAKVEVSLWDLDNGKAPQRVIA